jgi:hypothetical protein
MPIVVRPDSSWLFTIAPHILSMIRRAQSRLSYPLIISSARVLFVQSIQAIILYPYSPLITFLQSVVALLVQFGQRICQVTRNPTLDIALVFHIQPLIFQTRHIPDLVLIRGIQHGAIAMSDRNKYGVCAGALLPL